jgi:ribosomal RNA-processing protein 1
MQFGKKLVSSDPLERAKSFKKFKRWFGQQRDLTELEHKKLWKALYYCMWMSDKPQVQEELATELSQLVHQLQQTSDQLIFLAAFFIIIGDEWPKLDRLRIDKFYLLIRLTIFESFKFLSAHRWNADLVEKYTEILMKIVYSPNSSYPNGVKWFIGEEYIKQLLVALNDFHVEKNNEALLEDFNTTEAFTILLDTFIQVVELDKSSLLIKKILENIFLPLFEN